MPERKPDGWEKLSREGSAEGAQVGYDPAKPGNYHVRASGEIVWHGVPEGFHFDGGMLVPITSSPNTKTTNLTAAEPPKE